MNRPIEAVLFDLDGTLLDTAGDLGGALNHVLRAHGKAERPIAELRPYASGGSLALVCHGFGLKPTDAAAKALWQELQEYYAAHLSDHTTLFDGMADLLQRIEEQGRPWGVVTNKPARFTLPLLKAMQLHQRAACVVSGDTLAVQKPDPAPLLYAGQQLGKPCETCLYIGDARRDIEAGLGAGMYTLAAAYGYIAPGDPPQNWSADGIVNCPQEIYDWLVVSG